MEQLLELRKKEPIQTATDDYTSNCDEATGSTSPSLSSPPPVLLSSPKIANEAESDDSIHTEGLQNLRTELDAKFDLENISLRPRRGLKLPERGHARARYHTTELALYARRPSHSARIPTAA